jgi:hypothetical protein
LIYWQDFSSKLEIKKVMRGAEQQEKGTNAQGKDDAGKKLTKNNNKIIFIYPSAMAHTVIIAKDMDTVFC